MNKQYFFERNLLALSGVDPLLCSRLSGAETTLGRYRFLESRTGETIPAWVEVSGAHPLHSMVDPWREARRLVEPVTGEGFLILLGLGGGWCAEAALERDDIHRVLVIDFDINGMAELLCSKDYIRLFNDPRFFLMVDPAEKEIEDYIVRSYQPCLFGGIRVLPLRTRTAFGGKGFAAAGSAVEAAIGKISADYSVQAFFGTRWFSNILRNLERAEKPERPLPPIRRAAVAAAGPSLDIQIPALTQKREDLFLIAADTSLPCLLSEGVRPDAVVSIDCQHYSYYHFMEGGVPEGVLLFLDLASPPLVASRSPAPYFFSGGHPLTRWLSRNWRPLPELDTSGGNVTYAAVSLAEKLGARTIELYGADFSYPMGITYARGAYVYPYFEKDQNRLAPLEKKASSLLFRTPLEKAYKDGEHWYYETRTFRFYRRRLEEKSLVLEARLIPEEGMGPRLATGRGTAPGNTLRLFSSGPPRMKAKELLSRYRDAIAALPPFRKDISRYLQGLGDEAYALLTTLLPAAAALKRRNPLLEAPELLEAGRLFSLAEIDRVLSSYSRRLPR